MLPTDWELATKVAVAVVGILGLGLGLMNWRTAQRLGIHKLSETELGALLSGMEREEHDQAYRGFLKNIQKEKLVSLAFGCPVPLREIGRLMAYYEQGFATAEQIRLAWPHRNAHHARLSFKLGRSEKIQLWIATIYLALCALAGILLFVCALLPPWKVGNATAAGAALCFLGFSLLDHWAHHSLFVANELSKREPKE